ncbi:MAG: DUF4173 domain-containing protein [Planctomycetota bacterium]
MPRDQTGRDAEPGEDRDAAAEPEQDQAVTAEPGPREDAGPEPAAVTAAQEAAASPAGCANYVLGLPLRAWQTGVIILLTVAADVCLYEHPGGVGSGVLLLVAMLGLMAAAGKRARRASPGLMLVLILIAAASAWQLGGWLRGFVGWLALVAFAVRLHQPEWRVTEVIWAIPWTLLFAPARLLGHGLRCLGYGDVEEAPGEGRGGGGRGIPARVILMPLVVVFLFLLIFVAANPVVEHWANRVSAELTEWLGDLFTVPRMFTWFVWLMVFAALVRPVVRPWLAELLTGLSEDLTPGEEAERGDCAAALTTLIAVNVLFLAFNAVDASYLYLKAELPAGISYSEYSHRGCAWLTTGLVLSTVVIGVVFRGGLNFHPRRRVIRGLADVWALQNGVLAVGALRRLQMYIGYNGLTRLRIVGIVGVVLVAAGLGLMVWKVHRSKNTVWLIRRYLVAFWVTLAVLALTPRDLICARYNTAVIQSGNIRPLVLVHGQPHSAESYPAMIPLLDFEHPAGDAEKGELVRRGMASFLGRKLAELRADVPEQWTAFEGSHYWALARLEAVGEQLILPKEAGRLPPVEQEFRDYSRRWW